MPTPRRISDIKPLITNLAQTSHYEVIFSGLPAALRQHLSVRGIDNNFIGESVGLLCNSTSLPGSSFGTADIAGNYMGVVEKMAHTRIFTQIDLEFYVDSSYKTLKFLEHWMEFISFGSGVSPAQDGYFFRMRYPKEYKTDTTKIIKFDRDYDKQIEYTFFGMFPIAMNSVPVSYENSNILKVSASFNFDRYICGKATSYSVYAGIDNNRMTSIKGKQDPPPTPKTPNSHLLVPSSAGSGPNEGVWWRDPSKSLYENLYGPALKNIRERKI
mgnify:CR=1 FL=1